MSGVARIRRPRIARRIPIAVLSVVCVVGSVVAFGVGAQASTKSDLDAAQAQLDSLNQKLDQLVEEYDQTHIALQTTETRLDRQRTLAEQARAEYERIQGILSERAAAAYEGGAGSALDVVLGATSLQDLTD